MFGVIEVVVGSMFSGKTEEVIRRGRRAVYAGQHVQFFKHDSDSRYHTTALASHSGVTMQAVAVQNVEQMLALILPDTQVVVIDEGQFFGDALVAFAMEQRDSCGRRLIIAGLDMDFEGKPFDPMPTLMAISTLCTKTRAICTKCGSEATYSQRIKASSERVVIGERDSYAARCRQHWNPAKFE